MYTVRSDLLTAYRFTAYPVSHLHRRSNDSAYLADRLEWHAICITRDHEDDENEPAGTTDPCMVRDVQPVQESAARLQLEVKGKTMISHASISLCDNLNPGFGYQVRITNDRGQDILFTANDPNTGKDLLTWADALRVLGYYSFSGSKRS